MKTAGVSVLLAIVVAGALAIFVADPNAAREARSNRPAAIASTVDVKLKMCREAKEAAHYIAAISSTQDDVVRATNRVIAERKYPTLGDKATAMVGGIVGMNLGKMTPDEISELVGNRNC